MRLVTLSVQVQDKFTGALITGLGPEDFDVRDNGEEVIIKVFEHDSAPSDVLILRDIGGVASANAYKRMTEATRLAVQEFGGEDRIAVVAFASKLRVLCDWTSDKNKVGRALFPNEGRIWSKGRLLDAIVSAANLMGGMRADEPRRKLLLLVTDGRASKSQASLGRATAKVLEAGCTVAAVFYSTTRPWKSLSIWFPPGIIVGRERRAPYTKQIVIEPIVRETGGELVTGDADADVFRGLVRRFRTRYLLGYYPPETRTRSFRTISIRLKGAARLAHPNVTISSRSGYYSGCPSNRPKKSDRLPVTNHSLRTTPPEASPRW